MERDDIVVLYQHFPRKANWLEERRKEFAHAVGADDESIVTIHSPSVNDVAFFAAIKSP